MPFTRTTAAEYNGPNRTNGIEYPYAALVKALGEPHKRTDPDYPDDDYKTDVCWCVRSNNNPQAVVTIWNYKNGPAYNDGEGTIEEIDYFSVYQNDQALFNEVLAAIAQAAE